MKIFNSTKTHTTYKKIFTFYKNENGAAAIEFALIAPIFLLLYYCIIEVLVAVETHKNLRQTATAVIRSLEHSHFEINKKQIKDIVDVSKFIMNKRHRDKVTISLGILMPNSNTKNPEWRFLWQTKKENNHLTKYFSTTELEMMKSSFQRITTKNTYLSFASASLIYRPIFFNLMPFSTWDGIELYARLISRAPITQFIKCIDCS